MSNAQAAERVEVDPGEIEKELVRVWRDAAQADVSKERAGSESSARVRATLSNFVILSSADETGHSSSVDDIITALCISHPSRFFLLKHREDKTSDLKTFVSSRCVLARSGAHVCSEEVHVQFGEKADRVVPNLLLSLFAADVPVVLLVRGEIEGLKSTTFKSLFQSLAAHAQLILFDSLCFSNYVRNLLPLLELTAWKGESEEWFPRTQSVRVRDLAWYRNERWRLLIAEQFDSDRLRRGVNAIAQIRIRCKASKGGAPVRVPSAALLSAGWFCDALRWKPAKVRQKGNSLLVECTSANSGKPVLEFVFEQSTQPVPDDVIGISVRLSPAAGNLELKIAREAKEERATIAVESPAHVRTEKGYFCDFSLARVPFRSEKLEDLLIRPLYSGSSEDHFVRSAAKSLQIAQLVSALRV